jgi:hypothetical protein
MKSLIFLILLCATVYGADRTTNSAPEITTKVTDIPGKGGKPDTRIETMSRGKTKVLMTMSRRNASGAMVVTTRCCLVAGKVVMAESDEHGDGVFRLVTVFNPSNPDDFEMFTRQPDGSLKPMSTEAVNAAKKKTAVADESLRKLLEQADTSK